MAPHPPPASTHALAGRLVDVVAKQIGALAAGPLPGLTLPRQLAGHEVGPDVRADLLFTLGLLHECGRTDIGGVATPDAIAALLAEVDGRRTHTFYSYRVAETVLRFGAFATSTVLQRLTDGQRAQVAEATDSTAWVVALDEGRLPRNYAAVLARCELARRRLGLPVDEPRLEALLDRVRAMLGGFLDDSNGAIGRYDIYTVDIHLFCEPLADDLGEPWRQGARRALDLVDRVATRDGTAVPWGRSTGVLALCHTLELAGLVAAHDALTDEPGRWFARAAAAIDRLDGWFRDGWVTAHQHRASDPYRGLDRRLQLTFDCLGKLVDTARALLDAPDAATATTTALFGDRDEVVWLDRGRNAGVWTYRSAATAFALPLVGGTTTDYLPAPRNPGLFELPVGSPLVTGTPVAYAKGKRYAAAGLPVESEHEGGRLRARYEGFPLAGSLEPPADEPPLAATRDVTWRVEGRTLHVDEHLTFPEDRLPQAVGLQVTEAADRPLHVRFDIDGDGAGDTDGEATTRRVATLDVDGIAEYRSCWGELPRVHQVDLDPAADIRFRWSVTPVLRIVSTAAGHHYNDSLYGPLAERVRIERLPHSAATGAAALAALAARTDQIHLHWPEWLMIGGVDAHGALIGRLRAHGVRIVWTQHNLVPHSKDPTMGPVYGAWARAADLVIHHSRWGRDRALATYPYGAHTRHVVIAHGHFGPDTDTAVGAAADAGGAPATAAVRADVERELGLRAGVLRLGIVGAPRVEKDTSMVMRAVARSGRDDLELLVLSLDDGDVVPDDPRIKAWPYEIVPRAVYDRRLAAIDALVMPFDPAGEMLTTGTMGDALGFGLPTIASSWPYLQEALGDAAITYGETEDDLVACLDGLAADALARAGAAARERRPRHEWTVIAAQTYAELDRLGSTRH